MQDGWRWSPDGKSIAFWQLVADQRPGLRPDQLHRLALPGRHRGPVSQGGRGQLRGPHRRRAGGWWRDPLAGAARRSPEHLRRTDGLGGQLRRGRRSSSSTGCRTPTSSSSASADGAVKAIYTEHDSAWVDVVNDFTWLDGGKKLPLGERARRLESRLRGLARRPRPPAWSPPEHSTSSMSPAVDSAGGWLYYIASPDNPTQRYLYPGPPRRQGQGRSGSHRPSLPGSQRVQPRSRLQVRLPQHSSLRRPRRPRPGSAAGPCHRPAPGGQHRAQGQGRGPPPGHARVLQPWTSAAG